MHDYHAVEALVERLREELGEREQTEVAEVRIRADSVFSSEALQQAYEMLTADTPLEGSRLVVEELESEWQCPSCGGSWTVSRDDLVGHLLVCPSCGSASSIESGHAIEVAAIERR
jgi:hydrogenase nickel incorporation protein HypA/HybF